MSGLEALTFGEATWKMLTIMFDKATIIGTISITAAYMGVWQFYEYLERRKERKKPYSQLEFKFD